MPHSSLSCHTMKPGMVVKESGFFRLNIMGRRLWTVWGLASSASFTQSAQPPPKL